MVAIKLTSEIRTYASNVAAVGNEMGKTGEEFGKVSELPSNSLEDIQRKKDRYSALLNEFESQKQTLTRQRVPKLLKSEHEELLSGFSKYVKATEMAINSLEVESVSVDVDKLERGQELQWEASGEIVDITNRMARILGI